MLIEIAKPEITEEEIADVIKVLKSGRLSAGPVTREFESAFAGMVSAKYAVATSSGTTALQAILRALDLRPGDEVITTPFSFVATSNVILDAGAVPVFVDIEHHTFNLDPDAVKQALQRYSRVRAILAVHLYGLPFSSDLVAIAERYGVYLIEDAAQAHGASINGKMVGSLGHIAAFSFYPTKNMTTTEGGMVTTSDSNLAERVRLIVNQGQRSRYDYACLGFNYRMTDLQAALGLVQLSLLPARNNRRREIAKFYNQNLPLELNKPLEPPGYHHVYHQYTLQSPLRARLMEALKREGIASNIYYPRLICQESFMSTYSYVVEPIPTAEQAVGQVFSIPVHPGLTNEEVATIVGVVNNEWEAACHGK
ncbi:MAG: DegT/DnrJ/EryC1/StrS family aminotransferase [Bacillota bacterium]|nr:DegT/DnrJ/EryC1/StrS family aminotransferase [Bacillota bacterium]